MKLLPTCRLCNFTSFHCLTAFSFPFTKNGKFDKLVEFVSSFPRWELERVSATDILFLPPFPSLGKHAPRARSDREGRSPEMGRRKKRKSQEGASLTTLLYSPLPISLPIELLCLLSIRRFFWDPSSGKENLFLLYGLTQPFLPPSFPNGTSGFSAKTRRNRRLQRSAIQSLSADCFRACVSATIVTTEDTRQEEDIEKVQNRKIER